jgi:2-dehydropantoate 2-reductase
MFPVIAIVGAGAVGGYYGAKLARAGNSVHFLLRSDYDVVRRRGIVVKSRDGDFELSPKQIQVYNDPKAMPKADLVLVGLKTTANDLYEPLIRPLLNERTTILTIQNGLGNEERLAELFGAERVVGGLAHICASRDEDGAIVHEAYGLIRLGEFAGPSGSRVESLVSLFQAAGVPAQFLPDLRAGRWEKLVWNIPFNGLGALLDLDTAKLLSSEPGRNLVVSVMNEVIQAGAAYGLSLPPAWVAQKLEFTAAMGEFRTSMQQDRVAGRPMELQSIFANPLAAAKIAGVAMPRVETIYRLLQVAAAGRS